MMILLHGDDQSASRKELEALKQKAVGKEIITLTAGQIDDNSLTQALSSDSLFGDKKLIIIEGLLTLKRKTDWEEILKKNSDKEIILWENKVIGKTIINKLPKNSRIRVFKIPLVIFKFLDSIYPGNEKNCLNLLAESLKHEESEMIFYMIIRQIRNLIISKDLGGNATSLSGWQLSKLTNQAKYFTINKLLSMEKNLLSIDIAVKTGGSPYPLRKLLEQFVLNQNENNFTKGEYYE